MSILISPHNDDETLFSSFVIQREAPQVIIVYDSFIQVARGAFYCDWSTRRRETLDALQILHPIYTARQPIFLGFHDDTDYLRGTISQAIAQYIPEERGKIYVPLYEEGGHDQHNLVATECASFSTDRYTTYTRHSGRTRSGNQFTPTPAEIARKHQALACYTSQITNPSTRSWFMGDIEEYYL